MSEDAELLRQYAQCGSETAFAELVSRYLPLVYAAALRQGCGDEALAKDVAQTVFIDLARKASSLLGRELLAGWLYTSTRLAASKAVRGEQRRQLRERIAVSMAEHTTPPESQSDQDDLRLVLDEAMSELDADERNAVFIRFFQGKELKEVGSALGISEDAARMRITRALANLQTHLKQRGVTIATVALGTALATEAVAAVPVGLAAGISATAIASAAAGSLGTLSIFRSMALAKLTLGITGAVFVGVLATVFFRGHRSQLRLQEENQALKDQIRQLAPLAAEAKVLSNELVQVNITKGKLPDEQFRELLRLRGEVGVLRRQNAEVKEAQPAPPEPVFEGKPLTAWLEELYRMTGPRSFDSWRGGRGGEVVRALGTNAVPYLVHMLTANRLLLTDKPALSAKNEVAFQVSFTTAGVNVMRAATACELLGPKAEAALPALIPLLESKDGGIRAQVLSALCFIQQDAEIVVPLLAERLADTDPRAQGTAVVGLTMFGAKARPALPALRKLAGAEDRNFSALASESIQKIENAPEK